MPFYNPITAHHLIRIPYLLDIGHHHHCNPSLVRFYTQARSCFRCTIFISATLLPPCYGLMGFLFICRGTLFGLLISPTSVTLSKILPTIFCSIYCPHLFAGYSFNRPIPLHSALDWTTRLEQGHKNTFCS